MRKSIIAFLYFIAVCTPLFCAPLTSDDQTALLMNFDSQQKGTPGPTLISGIYNKAGLFLSGKNVITVEEKNGELSFGRGSAATFELWLNPQKELARAVLLQKGSGANYALRIEKGRLTYTYYSSGGWRSHQTGVNIKQDAWTHIALTHSSEGFVSVFVNGTLAYRSEKAYPFQSVDDRPLYIGGEGDTDLYFGAMDDLRISKVVRYDRERKLAVGAQAFDVPSTGLTSIENDVMVALGAFPGVEEEKPQPAAGTDIKKSALSSAKIMEVSLAPNYRKDRDVTTGLLFDGNDATGYAWINSYAFPLIFLIDMGEEKSFDSVTLTALGGNSPYELPFYRLLAGNSIEKMYVIAENHDRANLPLHDIGHAKHPLKSTFAPVTARYLIVDVKPMGFFTELRELTLHESDQGKKPTGKTVAYEDYYEYEYQGNSAPYPSEDYVTPHIKWAKPLAGGKIKTLALMSYPTCRDIIEIAQRADLDWEFVGTKSNKSTPLDIHVARKLEKALDRDVEVMLIGSTRWITIPEKIQQKILNKVDAGMGLLYIQPRFTTDNIDAVIDSLKPAPEIIAGVPVELVQFLDQPKDPYILSGKHGKGNVVVMQYEPAKESDWWWTPDHVDTWWSACSIMPPIMPPQTELNASCEYVMSAIIRSMMAAANRDIVVPDIAVADGQVVVKVPRKVLRVEIVVCDERMNTLTQMSSTINGRQAMFPLNIALPSGRNSINCRVFDNDDNIVGWGTGVVKIDDSAIGGIDIELKPRDLGQEVEGRLVLENGPTRIAKTEIEVRDTYDRVIDLITQKGAIADFSFSTKDATGQGVIVTARIYGKAGNLLDQEQTIVPLRTEPDNDDYIFSAWGEYPFMILRPYGVHFWKQSQKMGYDRSIAFLNYWPQDTRDQIKSGYSAFYPAFIKNNIRPLLIYVASGKYAARPSNKENVRLADEKFYKDFTTEIKYRMNLAKPWNVTDVFWGDETKYFEDKTPEMLALFRDYLKKQYGALAALNKSWQTQFAAWADVVPATFWDVEKKKRNIGQYIEFQTFLEKMMLQYYKRGYEAAQEAIPGATVGLTGTAEPGTLGNDWSQTLKYMDHILYYWDNGGTRLTREALRAFGSPGSIFYMWTGYDYYDRNEIYARYAMWSDLLYGFNGIGIYAADSFYRVGYRNHGAINPDFTFAQRGEWHQRETREIKQGIGKLLCISENQNSPVTVYYSIESLRGGGMVRWLQRSSTYFTSAPTKIVNSTFEILRDLQYSPNFINYGRFSDNRAKQVVVLPATNLLSDAEIEQLAAFVSDGGNIISFGHPAYMNQRGEFRAENRLRTVLGATPGQPFWRIKSDVRKFSIGENNSEIVIADAKTALADNTQVLLRTVDGLPLVTRHSYGKGKAYFINGFPSEYSAYRPDVYGGKDLDPASFKEVNAGAYRKLLATCLKDAGISPAYTVSSASYSQGVPYFEIQQFKNGDVVINAFMEAYLEFLRTVTASHIITPGDYRRLKVNFKQKAHVYDLRAGKYLGYIDSTRLSVAPTVARVLALSPEKVEGVAVKVKCRRGQVKVKIGIAGLDKTKFTPVVRIDVYDPQNKKTAPYSKNLVLDGKTKSGVYTFKHALNDEKGTWRIEITDVLSGIKTEKSYNLKK